MYFYETVCWIVSQTKHRPMVLFDDETEEKGEKQIKSCIKCHHDKKEKILLNIVWTIHIHSLFFIYDDVTLLCNIET